MAAAPTAISTTEMPPRPRRRILLSLRMLAAIVLLLGLGSALWVGVPAYRQHAAIEEIHRASGWYQSTPAGPAWLRQLLGDSRMQLFDHVYGVTLYDTETTDTTLRLVSHLRETTNLNVCYGNVTDAGIRHLARMTNLRKLRIDSPQVTDAGIAHLSGLVNLELLELSEARVTGAGLAPLQGLPKLNELLLCGTTMNGAELVQLVRLRHLRLLDLSDSRIGDSDVIHLKRLTSLEELNLSNSDITDAALGQLSEMTNLRCLKVDDTQVTTSGIRRFKQALPEVDVYRRRTEPAGSGGAGDPFGILNPLPRHGKR